MANLKDLRNRIKSVQSTKKITAAMKMISAAKLKKAQLAAESSRPYAEHMGHMMADLIDNQMSLESAPALLTGTGSDHTHLLVVITSNRGLCGGFNSLLVRRVRVHIRKLQAQGKTVKLIAVGKKGFEILRQDCADLIIGEHLSITNPRFFNAETIAQDILNRFENREFDICSIFFNKFISTLSQDIIHQQLIPFQEPESTSTDTSHANNKYNRKNPLRDQNGMSIYEYEPSQHSVLERLLPTNIKIQLFSALLESTASEHGARMSAMDGATRNAEELIGNLNLTYNRTRQAVITNELIEIISGAEAL